ncbi:SWIM-type domain-containing protein [Mycena kentingensis (nom. inval.)]|nr:SWIM-type domain-containing protein [Mycena kentingensis (nom. inval.)]
MPDAPPAPVGPTRKCTGKDCKTRLAVDDKYKKCAHCRHLNSEAQKRKRARDRAQKEEANEPAVPGAVAPEPPAKRMRTEDGAAGTQSRVSEEYTLYDDADELYADLRAARVNSDTVHFKGCFKLPKDASDSPKERVKITNRAVRVATGYRWTVHRNLKLVSGHKTEFWCSQDDKRKKKSKPSTKPGVKHRETPGMERFPCRSRLVIACHSWGVADADEHTIFINLRHCFRHDNYEDHSFPAAALAMVLAADEDVTPSALSRRIRKTFKVSHAQVYNAWREKNEAIWRRDILQIPSARKLLAEFKDDVDLFEPKGVPDDVEILCWGMKAISTRLKGRIEEVAMDATRNLFSTVRSNTHKYTDSTNAKDLELYALMGEFDNAGFPLAYCLLSTTTSISRGKRVKSLTAFATCVRESYDLHPEFVHVDKDLGEINALKAVFKPKISICWWHVNDAVGKRIKLTKMSTTPYNAIRARAEFSFIQADFTPTVKADKKEYEGGKPHDADVPDSTAPPTKNPSKLTFKLPLPAPVQPLREVNGVKIIRLPPLDSLDVEFDGDDSDAGSDSDSGSESGEEDGEGGEEDCEGVQEPSAPGPSTVAVRDVGPRGKRKKKNAAKKRRAPNTAPVPRFVPEDLQSEVLTMMQQHSFAHPLIPGDCAPSAEAIRYWAVDQLYKFCVKYNLRGPWAYLWENWYRLGRWELWTRAAHSTIPRLRTTMICESHWRLIKEDYLPHFHSPRVDMLAWVLVKKLGSTYVDKLNKLMTRSVRVIVEDLPSWRKTFRTQWRNLELRDVAMQARVDHVYRPNVDDWVCSCPAFKISRFLICKHLVQLVRHVPTRFFREAQRNRTTPFWKHRHLIPLAAEGAADEDDDDRWAPAGEYLPRDLEVPDDEDRPVFDGDDEEEQWQADAAEFDATLDRRIAELERATAMLRHQRQFKDPRFLAALERNGAAFFRFTGACAEKEDRARNNRGQPVRTWEDGDAMFYRPRPRVADEGT